MNFLELPIEIIYKVLNYLSDNELIETWLQPLCKYSRQIALTMIFRRSSYNARIHQKFWLRYHLLNNTLAENNDNIENVASYIRLANKHKNNSESLQILLLAAKAILKPVSLDQKILNDLISYSVQKNLGYHTYFDIVLSIFSIINSGKRNTIDKVFKHIHNRFSKNQHQSPLKLLHYLGLYQCLLYDTRLNNNTHLAINYSGKL